MLIGTATGGNPEEFWQTLWMSLLIVAGTSLLFIVSRFMRIGFIRDIILDVRNLAFNKIQSLSYEGFSKSQRPFTCPI